jgi:hypothetical protein
VSFSVNGERGSIDILAFHPASRVVLVIEVKSAVPDVQLTLVTLDRKTRLAVQIARERGWVGNAIGRLLVIRESRTARRRVAAYEATFANTLPHRTWEVRRWLAAPVAPKSLAGLWFLPADIQAVNRRRVRRTRAPAERAGTSGS